MADYVGIDQGALVFTIGLGKQVGLPLGDPAGNACCNIPPKKPATACTFSPDATQLADIFKKIGDNIAIRLAR